MDEKGADRSCKHVCQVFALSCEGGPQQEGGFGAARGLKAMGFLWFWDGLLEPAKEELALEEVLAATFRVGESQVAQTRPARGCEDDENTDVEHKNWLHEGDEQGLLSPLTPSHATARGAAKNNPKQLWWHIALGTNTQRIYIKMPHKLFAQSLPLAIGFTHVRDKKKVMESAKVQMKIPIGWPAICRTFVHSMNHFIKQATPPFKTILLKPMEPSYLPKLTT
mmetsp:Transcript_50298/g.106900  ORF Transcript_50298/g.106900 Transcript_50298/m.106900 type:complete len:223 (+) Transcript_50298:498-1166(+)